MDGVEGVRANGEIERISVAHTPDADDAFMFYAMVEGKIPVNFEIENVVEDIEALNEKAFNGVYDVTAISVHGYAYVCEKYRILAAGASVGDGYGPIVVSKSKNIEDVRKVAIPGRYTTAALLLQIAMDDVEAVEMRFDRIPEAVMREEVDAGVLIHEGQITYSKLGLNKILDLWEWWSERTSLPLPLGVNVIKREIDEGVQRSFLASLTESIRYALRNPDEAARYAMKYGRGMEFEDVRKFAMMYVNEYTVEMPEEVIDAMDELFTMAEKAGIVKKPPLDVLFL